ncbi:MAG: hypothetical protein H8E66_30180 [Planctomycetes bacterium]|nr:hypothetical protein [Planctomycetota bacterium]
MKRCHPRFSLRDLFIVTTVVTVALSCYIYRISIWARVCYGPRIDDETVEVLAVDSSAYVLRIAGRNVLTEKCFGLALADGEGASARITGVWKTRQGTTPYVVRIGDEFVAADYCGPE